MLRFDSVDDAQAARGELSTVGALMALSGEQAPLQAIDVRVCAGAHESRTRVRCQVRAMQAGIVVVQALEKSAWLVALDELRAAATAPGPVEPSSSAPTSGAPMAAPGVPPARPWSLPRAGRLHNPRTPAAIFALPAQRAPTDADLERPSAPLLLRWLRTTRGVLRLDVTHAASTPTSLYFIDGRDVRASVGAAALGRALAEAELGYEITEVAKAPNLSHTERTPHVAVELVRVLLAQHTTDDLARAYPHTKDPRTVRAVLPVADALGFTGAHARLVKNEMAGDGTVADVLDNPIGPRTAWDVLTLLHLYDGLSFFAGERRADTAVASPPAGLPPEAMLAKDLFSVLGLHWSSAPSEVAAAYQQTRAAWTGPRRPSDEQLAERILARIEEAHRTLRDDERRRSYRRATFNLVWPHQAQLLVAQAKLALYRKDVAETMRLVHAAEDLAPSAEAAQVLAAVAKANAKSGR